MEAVEELMLETEEAQATANVRYMDLVHVCTWVSDVSLQLTLRSRVCVILGD